MKTSINAWSVEENTSFEDMFRQVKEAGFDGIELNLDAPGSAHGLSFETTEEEIEKIKALSEKYSLPIVSISSSQHCGMWGDSEPAVREKAKDVARKQIYFAKKFGATGILVVPGGMKEGRSLLDSWKNSITAMKEFSDEIKGCGIKVDIENVWNGFFTSPFDMVRFLDELDCPDYGVYFDAGNMDAFSWSEYWAEILSGRIDKVHVKGFRKNGGSINAGGIWCDIADGDINWKAVISELKKGGFDGYLTAEVGKTNDTMSWTDYYRSVRNQVQALCDYAK